MSSIAINDLTQKSQILDLEHSDTEHVAGGAVPVAVGIAAGTALVGGFGAGVALYDATN